MQGTQARGQVFMMRTLSLLPTNLPTHAGFQAQASSLRIECGDEQ